MTWCAVDRCPAVICGGPHRVVRTTLGQELLRLDQDPLGEPVDPLAPVPPPTLAEALDSLGSTLARNSRDWSADRADAWLWGALAGWDCEETHEHLPHCFLAMVEVAEQHQWDVVDVARLRGLRAAIRAAAVGAEPG